HVGEFDTDWLRQMQQQASQFRSKGFAVHFTIEKGEGHVMRTLAGESSARLFKEIEEYREGCSRKRGSGANNHTRANCNIHCISVSTAVAYMAMTAINARLLDRELKKGSAELIILSIVESRPRHGYEISKLIEARSGGKLKFHVASLYPLLYRLEERGWLQGRWVEKAGQRRRRFYSLTAEGRRILNRQRDTWKAFVHAMGLITGIRHA